MNEAGKIAEDIFLCPNCDLEFLPYPVAEKKVQLISEMRGG